MQECVIPQREVGSMFGIVVDGPGCGACNDEWVVSICGKIFYIINGRLVLKFYCTPCRVFSEDTTFMELVIEIVARNWPI